MNKELWRKGIDGMVPYIPGKPIEDVKREYGIEKITRLASNENPLGPSPKAIEAMQKAVADGWLYPEPTGMALRERLADLYQLDPEQFVVGNGADHLISMICGAFINEGDEVLYSAPTFNSYRGATLAMGGMPVEIPLTSDYVYDVDAILNAVTERTKVIFICNPNNPTGTILSPEKLRRFLDQVPSHVLTVLDEAYAEFIREDDYPTGRDFIHEGYQLITLRTFSKLYGLAGTRVGYAYGNEDVLAPIKVVRPTFEVNRIALAGAEATLDDLSYSKESLKTIWDEVDRLTAIYRDLGFDVIVTHTNFIFVDVKTDANQLSESLLHKGIIIRPCTPWGLDKHVRITIGSPDQNDLLVDAIRDCMRVKR